jgi:hypothetical protein
MVCIDGQGVAEVWRDAEAMTAERNSQATTRREAVGGEGDV